MKFQNLATVLVALLAQTVSAQDLHLICIGESAGNLAVSLDDQVSVDITAKTGRMTMPHGMVPPYHKGKDRWFELQNVDITEDAITATVRLNFLIAPKVRLDRTTGRIWIDGLAGKFSGSCEPYDPITVGKKF